MSDTGGRATERNFLDHYFGSVYDKLEADALLFNRKLPHAGLAGAENENALAGLLRGFLPPRFGLEVSGIVIDRHGRRSRQSDIIIYDARSFPTYLRKIFPVEIVHGVVEVKTLLTSTTAQDARENLKSVAALDFRPRLTNLWKTRSKEKGLQASPPCGFVFGFRTQVASVETFASWFPFDMTLDGASLLREGFAGRPEIRTFLTCCLDKGVIWGESTNLHVMRLIPAADPVEPPRGFKATLEGQEILVDPAKTLFLFLEMLWKRVSGHRVHPGFDIRTYMSGAMDFAYNVGSDTPMPENYYMAPPKAPKPEVTGE
jgi:Domain of unknown function (DUF6602)